MKILKKILKWIGLSIASLIVLIIMTGLISRCFVPRPEAPGELIDVGGHKLHIHATGVQNDKPTLVIIAGAGAPGEHYHWLSEGLKDEMRVVRYDRAGIGYSELADTPRDPDTEIEELHRLLELSGESAPYIMAGHSYGGHYIRLYAERYPEEVAGMIFLDSSHPETDERMNLPDSPWFIDPMYRIGALLADLGVIHIYDRNSRPLLWAPGLPEDIMDLTADYTYDGKHIRGYLRGDYKWGETLEELASQASDFDSLPMLVFSGTEQRDEILIRFGIDPEVFRSERKKMQEEIADMSSNSELFFMDGGHVTIYTLPENAAFIVAEVKQMLREMELNPSYDQVLVTQ